MKNLAVTLEQKIRLSWMIGQLSGNVALVKWAFGVLEKLEVPEDGSFTILPSDGTVTFILKSPATAKLIPVPDKAETDDERKAREGKNLKAQLDAASANAAEIAKIASASSVIELTDSEAKLLAAAMDNHGQHAGDARAWLAGIIFADAEEKHASKSHPKSGK